MCTEAWIAVGAIGTFLIVFINFYIIVVKPWWEAPKFSIHYRHGNRPCCRATQSSLFERNRPISVSGEMPSYWMRLRVTNSGHSTARQCSGRLMKIMNEAGEIDQRFDPMALIWAGTGWREVPFRTLDLAKGQFEYLNVLATQQGYPDVYLTGDQFPWSQYEERGINNRLEPGEYVLEVTVYGDNVEPETVYLTARRPSGTTSIVDISVEKHENLQQAMSWLKKST